MRISQRSPSRRLSAGLTNLAPGDSSEAVCARACKTCPVRKECSHIMPDHHMQLLPYIHCGSLVSGTSQVLGAPAAKLSLKACLPCRGTSGEGVRVTGWHNRRDDRSASKGLLSPCNDAVRVIVARPGASRSQLCKHGVPVTLGTPLLHMAAAHARAYPLPSKSS